MKKELPAKADELAALVNAVDKANPAPGAVAALREYLRANPEACEKTGNLAGLLTNQIVRTMTEGAKNGLSLRTAMLVDLERLRDDLGYDRASELEKTLIRHIVLCWLRLNDCELRYTAAADKGMEVVTFWEKKLTANQRRYLRSVETLARVRKLLKPERTPSKAFDILLRQQMGGK